MKKYYEKPYVPDMERISGLKNPRSDSVMETTTILKPKRGQTFPELAETLVQLQGSQFVSFIAVTEPKMRKTNNPFFGRVCKVSSKRGLVNFHYDEGVLRRLEKEGKSPLDFRKGESWHEPVLLDDRLTPLCHHKKDHSRLYLRFMDLGSNQKAKYFDTNTCEEIPEEALDPFIVVNDDEYGNQGLNAPLKFRVYGLDGIRKIKIGGESYNINPDQHEDFLKDFEAAENDKRD